MPASLAVVPSRAAMVFFQKALVFFIFSITLSGFSFGNIPPEIRIQNVSISREGEISLGCKIGCKQSANISLFDFAMAVVESILCRLETDTIEWSFLWDSVYEERIFACKYLDQWSNNLTINLAQAAEYNPTVRNITDGRTTKSEAPSGIQFLTATLTTPSPRETNVTIPTVTTTTKNFSPGAVAGIVIIVITSVAALAGLVFWVWKRYFKGRSGSYDVSAAIAAGVPNRGRRDPPVELARLPTPNHDERIIM